MSSLEPDPPLPVAAEEREAVARAAARLAPAGSPLRAQLLPLLHAVQEEHGWLSRGCLAAVAQHLRLPFPEVWGVATFYALLRTEPPRGVPVQVCDDVPCLLRGADALVAALSERWGPPRRFGGGAHGTEDHASAGPVDWEVVPCLGQCDGAPAAVVAGEVRRGAAPDLLLRAATRGEPRESAPAPTEGAAAAAAAAPEVREPEGAPHSPVRRLLARVGRVAPCSLEAYLAAGGYRGLRRALELGREGVLAELEHSGLLGRGGAAFPAALKWRAVGAAAGTRRAVCNADESEPGTFKDRVLLEGDPFAVIEGLTIAALTVGAEEALIYVRGEYRLAESRLAVAAAQAEAAGLLGADCAGSGSAVRLRLFRGAGAYVCGEETALFNSVEGRRGEPRNKPPFPTEAGLHGGPTLIHNVETLANVPLILADGADAFRTCGTLRSAGTKLFCLSGHVERPGVYELPLGTPLRDLLALGGGVRGGRALRAVLCGGAAGTFLGPEALDVPLSYEGLRAVGGTLGSGAVVVLDTTTDLWGVARRIARFFRDESCGRCVPCRVGTQRQLEIVERRAAGRARPGDEDLLRELAAAMADASICGLGQTACSAVLSALGLADGRRGGTGA